MISILGIAIPSGLVAGLILVGAKHVPRLMNEFGKTMSELRSKKLNLLMKIQTWKKSVRKRDTKHRVIVLHYINIIKNKPVGQIRYIPL